MPLILVIQSGPSAGKELVVQAGLPFRVGRQKGADLVIPEDAMMSNSHFVLEWEGTTCFLRDLNSRFGTVLNDRRISRESIQNADRIGAGQTTFVVRTTADETTSRPAHIGPAVAPASQEKVTSEKASKPVPQAPPLPEKLPLHARVVQILRQQSGTLYGIVDAARDPRVAELVRGSETRHQSLYEGEKGDELSDFAPYLVEFTAQAGFLEKLVEEGWGKSWGVFLNCPKAFQEIRRHLRHFLLVEHPDGREVYFRFYDPRVLRVFLPTCTAKEVASFFGPIQSFSMEGDQSASLLRFVPRTDGVGKERVALAP